MFPGSDLTCQYKHVKFKKSAQPSKPVTDQTNILPKISYMFAFITKVWER